VLLEKDNGSALKNGVIVPAAAAGIFRRLRVPTPVKDCDRTTVIRDTATGLVKAGEYRPMVQRRKRGDDLSVIAM
jgi:hypothetical protein